MTSFGRCMDLSTLTRPAITLLTVPSGMMGLDNSPPRRLSKGHLNVGCARFGLNGSAKPPDWIVNTLPLYSDLGKGGGGGRRGGGYGNVRPSAFSRDIVRDFCAVLRKTNKCCCRLFCFPNRCNAYRFYDARKQEHLFPFGQSLVFTTEKWELDIFRLQLKMFFR